MKIPINEINPYNKTHPKGFEFRDKHHRNGIEKVKNLIKQNKRIRPIAIEKEKTNGKHQRLDGFKRYFAFKELDYKKIECIFAKKKGCQDGMSWET